MNDLTTTKKIILYTSQLIAAVILAKAAYGKFIGGDMAVEIFKSLNMEETRSIIAVIEACAAFLLITKSLSHYGAVLGFATMLGALIAHLTVLGVVVNNDGGMTIILMAVVIVLTSIIMWIKRRSLPLIGYTFD